MLIPGSLAVWGTAEGVGASCRDSALKAREQGIKSSKAKGFPGCTGTTTITVPDHIPSWGFCGCGKLDAGSCCFNYCAKKQDSRGRFSNTAADTPSSFFRRGLDSYHNQLGLVGSWAVSQLLQPGHKSPPRKNVIVGFFAASSRNGLVNPCAGLQL